MAIRTGEDYIQSLRGRDLKVYLFGELVKEPVDHPMIRPSINAVAETYDLAVREEDLASATSAMTGKKISRFLHIAESAEDLVMQNKMQRKLGQNTATCFQRCVGRIMGWSTGSFTSSPKRYTLRSLPRRLWM